MLVAVNTDHFLNFMYRWSVELLQTTFILWGRTWRSLQFTWKWILNCRVIPQEVISGTCISVETQVRSQMCIVYVVIKAALWQGFLRIEWVSPVSVISSLLHTQLWLNITRLEGRTGDDVSFKIKQWFFRYRTALDSVVLAHCFCQSVKG